MVGPEMAQGFRARVALAEDLGWVPRIHTATQLSLITVPGYLTPLSDLAGHQPGTTWVDRHNTQAEYLYTEN